MSFLSLGEVVVPVGEVSTVMKNCISDQCFRLHQRHDRFKFLL